MTTHSQVTAEYPSRKRRLLANLSSSSTVPSESGLPRHLPQRELKTDGRPNSLTTSKARHVLLACRDNPLPHYQTFQQSPLNCKVVQKVGENTWIELNVPCDGASLQEASNTIQQFATSYTSTSYLANERGYSVPSQYGASAPNQYGISVSNQYGASGNPPLKTRKISIEMQDPDNEQSDTTSIPIDSPVCSICQGPAESLHSHYGARSCLSCRAFFRRCVQIEIYPKFACSANRTCVITPGNRSKCKLCRFEKCQEMGMKISAVLNQDQKQVRFRKHFEQKHSQQIDMKKILRRFRRNNHAA